MPVMPWKAAILFVLAATYTPGPNNLMAMDGARRFGLRRCLPFLAGMSSGLIFVIALSGLFNLFLKAHLPRFQPVLGVIGALYLLYLAFRPFLPSRGPGGAQEAKACTPLQGFLFQLINPKVILYGLTLMSSFVVPWNDTPFVLLLVSIAAGVLAFSSQVLWGLFGSLFQRCFSRFAREVDVLMALLLIYCAWTISGLGAFLPRLPRLP